MNISRPFRTVSATSVILMAQAADNVSDNDAVGEDNSDSLARILCSVRYRKNAFDKAEFDESEDDAVEPVETGQHAGSRQATPVAGGPFVCFNEQVMLRAVLETAPIRDETMARDFADKVLGGADDIDDLDTFLGLCGDSTVDLAYFKSKPYEMKMGPLSKIKTHAQKYKADGSAYRLFAAIMNRYRELCPPSAVVNAASDPSRSVFGHLVQENHPRQVRYRNPLYVFVIMMLFVERHRFSYRSNRRMFSRTKIVHRYNIL